MNKFLPRYRTDEILFASTIKHVRPHLRFFLNKIWKAGKISFFSTKCPRSNHTGGNAWMMIVWPCHHKSILHDRQYFFDPLSRILSSIWSQWSGEQQFGSQTRLSHRDETSVAIAAINASVAAAAHNSIKVVARPASKHQNRSQAHITSYPDAILMFCERNPVRRRKTRPNPDNVQRKPSLNGATSARETFCPTTLDWKASIASSSRINCVHNKVRKTIASIANQVLFAASVAYTRSYLHSRWSINQKRRYLSDSKARP